MAVLASAVRLPSGLTAELLLGEGAGALRPGLHHELKDEDGWPLAAAYVADLPETAWLSGEEAASQVQQRFYRAIALLEAVADELAAKVGQVLPPLEQAPGEVVAGWSKLSSQSVERVLTIECLVEAEMPAQLQEQLGEWVSRRIGGEIDARRFNVEIVPVQDAGRVWERMQRLLDEDTREAHWYLLLSAYSALDADMLSQWQTAGLLRSARNRDGLVPGEAAAGILLATPAAAEGAVPVLKRPRQVSLSAEASAASRGRSFVELVRETLAVAETDAASVVLSLADARQNARSLAEGACVVREACPDLDTAAQYLPFGACVGELGPTQPLAMLALAEAGLSATPGAALLLGLEHPTRRWAAVLNSLTPTQEDRATSQPAAA